MKICVPTAGNNGLEERIGEHFGRVPTYTIYDTESKEITVIENTSHHTGGSGYPPELLDNNGVNVLLCSGLGWRAIGMFREKGIKVYIGAHGTVKDAIESWEQGKLQEATDDSACSRHAFRSELHGTGQCGKNQ